MKTVIEVNGLTKSFDDVHAVNGVSFSIREGTCFGLLGPNGAGKTTTLEMLEGLSQPDSGTIAYYGSSVNKEALNTIGIQFQQTSLQDYLKVGEALELFAAFYDNSMSLEKLIKLCDLSEILDRDHKKLSGGQKQRLLLAIALVNDPKVLFLDEPTTGLDPQARRNFWDLINDIKRSGKTVVLTTHYMDEAQYLCDEIIIMDKGKVIERGVPSQLLSEHFQGGILTLPIDSTRSGNDFPLEHQVIGDHIEIQTDSVETSVRTLINAGIPLEGLHVKSANLEDLFLKLTGHALRG